MGNRAVVYWKLGPDGGTDVWIDFGERARPGFHFGIGYEITLPEPNEGETQEWMDMWKERMSSLIAGDVMALLTNPVGTLLSAYMLRIQEVPVTRYLGYISTHIENEFIQSISNALYEGYLIMECTKAGIRRTAWPTPKK